MTPYSLKASACFSWKILNLKPFFPSFYTHITLLWMPLFWPVFVVADFFALFRTTRGRGTFVWSRGGGGGRWCGLGRGGRVWSLVFCRVWTPWVGCFWCVFLGSNRPNWTSKACWEKGQKQPHLHHLSRTLDLFWQRYYWLRLAFDEEPIYVQGHAIYSSH